MNSATSGLYNAMGAAGVGPGDEVIVALYYVSFSHCVLVYNGFGFADIEEDCFCLESDSVEQRITPYTRAIIVIDIFGQLRCGP